MPFDKLTALSKVEGLRCTSSSLQRTPKYSSFLKIRAFFRASGAFYCVVCLMTFYETIKWWFMFFIELLSPVDTSVKKDTEFRLKKEGRTMFDPCSPSTKESYRVQKLFITPKNNRESIWKIIMLLL